MSGKKRQELPKQSKSGRPSSSASAPMSGIAGEGVLYVVATPIGNLEDLSPRAKRILAEVDAILCEDTRMTAKLLNAYGITYGPDRPLERADHHLSPDRMAAFVDRLCAGEKLALVSDAGTPAISDPGADLVRAASLADVPVVVIPGPSALPAFLSGAGLPEGSPVFRGFFPRKNSDRALECDRAEALPFDSIWVWFESPERVVESVAFLAERFPGAEGAVAKELTKVYERFYRGKWRDITSHIQSAAAAGEIRGEWVIGIRLPAAEAALPGEEWRTTLESLIRCGISASRAAREVSQVFGISRKEIYAAAVETAKALGNFSDEDANDISPTETE